MKELTLVGVSCYYNDLLDGNRDCVDRIVLHTNLAPCYLAGGFRFLVATPAQQLK